jgi:WD40 repeat protein
MVATHPASGQFVVGRRLGGNDEAVTLRHFVLAQGEVQERPEIPLPSPVVGMTFDTPGLRLAAVLRNGALRVVELATGRKLFEQAGSCERAAFGAGDSLFALQRVVRNGQIANTLQHLDAATGTVRARLATDAAATALAVSPRGDWVAYGTTDRRVQLVDAKDLTPAAVFRAHEADVGRVAFHPHQSLLATASADGTLKLWSTRNLNRPVATFLGLAGTPTALSFNPVGNWLLVDGQERTTRVFDVSGVKAE